jgi:hypothetical protein
MIIECEYHPGWPRCRAASRYPTYDKPRCGELASFKCDRCGAPLCMLCASISEPPAVEELCPSCRDDQRATEVVRRLEALGRADRQGQRGRLRAWLACVLARST